MKPAVRSKNATQASDGRLLPAAPCRARGGWDFFGGRTLAVLRPLIAAGLVFSASGCLTTPGQWIRNGAKVGPNYCQPVVPVADEWILTDQPGVQNRLLTDTQWWKVFEDETLDSLIQIAYAQNYDVRSAGLRVLEARARQKIAVGTFFPQNQQMVGGYSRVGLSETAANNPALLSGLSFPGFSNPYRNFYSDWQSGFSLNWELDFWGRFRRGIESANAQLDASVENFDAVLVTLIADVATNYVQYRVLEQRIAIARENEKIQEQILALAEEKFRIGTTTQLDVEQAKTVLERTRANIPNLQIQLGQANDTLCVLLGMPPRDLTDELGKRNTVTKPPMPHTPDWVAAGIPADLLRQRPDVRQAEREVAAQSAQIGIAEAALYPSLFVNGTLGYEAQDLSDLFTSKSFMGTITPSFQWNILNYGRIQNNVRLQIAKTEQLIADYQNLVLNAGRETQTALRGFVRSREEAEHLALSVKAASAATELGITQYQTGVIDFNRVFNLELTQVQQQELHAIAEGNISLNLINVYRALGGGWEIRLDSTASAVPDAENSTACWECLSEDQ